MGLVSSAFSTVLYLGEKFTACIAFTSLLVCLIVTLVFTLGLGVGLGYNYCYVDLQTKYKKVLPRYRMVPPEHRNPRNKYNYPPGYYPHAYPPLADGSPDPNLDLYREDPTLPSLSGNDPNRFTLAFSTAPNNFNETASPPLNGTATSPIDTLRNVTLHPNSTLAVNTTEVFNTSDSITSIEEIIEKGDIDEGLPKMSVPISGIDLIGLLSRLRAENKNYSLQIVT